MNVRPEALDGLAYLMFLCEVIGKTRHSVQLASGGRHEDGSAVVELDVSLRVCIR